VKKEPRKRRGRGDGGAHMWTESMRADASATIGQRRRERSPIHAASMQWSYMKAQLRSWLAAPARVAVHLTLVIEIFGSFLRNGYQHRPNLVLIAGPSLHASCHINSTASITCTHSIRYWNSS